MQIRTGGLSYVLLMIATLVGGLWGQQNNTNSRKVQKNTANQGVYNLSEINTVDSLLNRRPNIRHPKPEGVKVECNTLRSKRYISDGFCTSVRPITEVVCTGHCLPIDTLPWWSEFVKVISRNKLLDYRCVNDVVRRKRVRLLCKNGDTRTYKIKVVKSCKCKRSNSYDNRSRRKYRKGRKKDKRKNLSDPPPKPLME